MYIADTNNNRFQRWTKGAKTVVTIAGDPNSMPGIDATKFQGASAVAINPMRLECTLPVRSIAEYNFLILFERYC